MRFLLTIMALALTFNVMAVNSDLRNIETSILSMNPLDSTERDALTPVQGQTIWNVTDGTLNFYNGSSWEAVATGLSNVTKEDTANSIDVWVNSFSGNDSQTGKGSKFYPYLTIQAAFNGIAGAITLNQWANEKINLHIHLYYFRR